MRGFVLLIGLIGVLFSVPVWAGEINTTYFKKLAIDGYDPVAYHISGKPVEGLAEFSHKWKGATWRFSSEKHLEMFTEAPERYAPAYGGHCANGMSEGHKVGSDPGLFRIINDKLYLYFAPRGRARWSSNTDQWIKDADANWIVLKDD